jgi:hypothetical protein
MSELLYSERISHFNEERRLVAQYLKSVTPDAATIHATVLHARNHSDIERIANEELAILREKESRLTTLFEQKTELIYKSKSAEDERLERISFLSELPPLMEIEKDTTYYYHDRSQQRRPTSGGSKDKSDASKAAKPIALKRVTSGKEAKLEADLQREMREANELKTSINKYLDSIEGRSVQYTSSFSKSVASLKAEAERLLAEAERIDMVSYTTVVELLSLRLKVMVIQREELEDSERLEKEIKYYSDKETSLHMQLNNEVTELNRKFDKEIQDNLREYQQQLSALSLQEVKLLQKTSGATTGDSSSAEVAALEREEAAAKARYEKLRLRNQLEMEGFNTESLALRKRLLAIERQLKPSRK